MTISFINRRCTVDVNQTAKGYSFEYGGKRFNRSNEEAVHNFFLKKYQANKLDTVKMRFSDTSYYLHFTLDEPEKLTKRQLRAILAQECDGAWCEDKNGKKRYFVREGWLFPRIKELTHEEFTAYKPASTIQKAMKLALRALSLISALPSQVPQATGMSALLFPLTNAGTTLAQMPAIGEFRINTNTTNVQWNPALAALNDGGVAVAWQGYQTGDFDIYGQRYNTSGVPIGSEFRINSNTTGNQFSPAFAALNDGGFVVAWFGDQTGNYDIYGQRDNVSGAPMGSEFRINSDTTGTQSTAALAALKDGGGIVAWEGDQTGDFDIYGQRYNASGVPIGSEFRINSNTTNDQSIPAVAALNDGGFVVAWMGYQTGNYDIYGQRYNATGVPIGSEFRINSNTTGDQANPALAALNDGSFVAAWDGDQTGNSDIYGQRYNATGVPMGSEFRINSNTTADQDGPALAALKDGGFLAAWEGDQTGNYDIYGQKYNATGVPIGSEFRINSNTTGDQYGPSLAALNDGGIVVVWTGDQAGNSDIYGQRYDANGVPVLTGSLSSSSLTMDRTTTSIAISGSGISPSTSSTSGLSTSTSQVGSSSIQFPQPSPAPTTSELTSAPSTSSASVLPTSYSQNNNITQIDSSQSSSISSLGSSQSPLILSITEIIYGSEYTIFNSNGEIIGTFTINGGTGVYDATQSNTLILQLDPDADLVGQTFNLFTVTADEEGNFETIELQGVTCASYDTQTVQDGNSRFYQATIQATTCTTGSKPTVSLLPNMLRV